MFSLVAQVAAAGRPVALADFKRGDLREGAGPTTTMLTDVVGSAIEHCARYDNITRTVVLRSSGYFSARFDLVFESAASRVCCGRRLVRGGFPFNPLAAEDPRNYDVVVTAASTLAGFEQSLMEMLHVRHYARMVATPEIHARYLRAAPG